LIPMPFCKKFAKPIDKVTRKECREECLGEGQDDCPSLTAVAAAKCQICGTEVFSKKEAQDHFHKYHFKWKPTEDYYFGEAYMDLPSLIPIVGKNLLGKEQVRNKEVLKKDA